MKMSSKYLFKIIVFLVFFSLGLNVVLAAKANVFTIYPSYTHMGDSSKIIHNLKPGDTVKDFVTVENLSKVDDTFRVYFLEGVDKKGQVFTKKETDPVEHIGELVGPFEQIVDLKAGEKKQLEFSYAVPRDFTEGKYVGVFYVENFAHSSSLQPGVNVKTRVGVRMYTKVSVSALANTHAFMMSSGQKLFFVLSTALLLLTFLWNLLHYNFNRKLPGTKKLSH